MIAPNPQAPLSKGTKRVTIAAGIMCANGIVMCADSQETYGDFKWPVKKLSFPRATAGNFSILISGAGFGPAIDAAAQQIFAGTAMKMPSYEYVIHVIQEVLRDIHEKDLQFYPTNDRSLLQFRLLIAFQADGRGGLFVSDGSILTRVDSFQIIGSGEITRFFADIMYRKSIMETPDIGIEEGAVLAAFLVYLGKSQLTSIGGKSQLAMIDLAGRIRFANVWEAPAWESLFADCLKVGTEIILDCANPSLSEKEFSANMSEYALSLRKLKRVISKKRKHWDRLWHEYNQAGVTLLGHTPMQSDSQT